MAHSCFTGNLSGLSVHNGIGNKCLLLKSIAGLLDEEAGVPFIATTPGQLSVTQAVEFRDVMLPEESLFFSKRLCFFVFPCRI
ncbi:hypothetical protein [Endozoicomonas acroporae]|uniref:hypothetical protein n=1 Tax=Endozoicomonas acroporae TaxID=1701104 RepID=UPI003D7AD9E8